MDIADYQKRSKCFTIDPAPFRGTRSSISPVIFELKPAGVSPIAHRVGPSLGWRRRARRRTSQPVTWDDRPRAWFSWDTCGARGGGGGCQGVWTRGREPATGVLAGGSNHVTRPVPPWSRARAKFQQRGDTNITHMAAAQSRLAAGSAVSR